MKSILRSVTLAATVVGGLAAQQAVAAPFFDVRDNSSINGSSVFLNAALSISISTNSGGSYSGQSAGAFALQRTPNPSGVGSVWTNFITYCFELTQTLSLPDAYEARVLTSSMSVSDASAIGKLWSLYFTASTTSGTVGYGGTIGNTDVSERSAAFQAAVWNIVTEAADGESESDTGTFRVGSGKVADLTEKYLKDAYAAAAGANIAGLYNPSSVDPTGAGQNLLIPCTDAFGSTDPRCGGGGGTIDTPVPATLVLFGAGLVALAGLRRRKA